MPAGTADYTKHTDAELREGIEKVNEQEQRIEAEDSAAALEAAREQREQMQAELRKRAGGGAGTSSP